MNKFPREQFDLLCQQLQANEKANFNFLYDVFCECLESAKEMQENKVLGKSYPLNPYIILLYLLNEYNFLFLIKNTKEDEEGFTKLASITLDKYFTNEHLNYKNDQITSRFSVTISTLDIYLNLMLGVLQKFPHNNPKETLLLDVANKALKVSKAITGLITSGFETEAFSAWRTLHESECILAVISKYGEPVIKSYLKHMNYAIAFRGGLASKEETDKIFEQIKSEMKALDLKSKDMKKFIEYGWLTASEDFSKIEGIKFNFRDGVEKLAGLEGYSQVYEMASEIAHSSPLLIYSQNKYYYLLTIMNLYETYFRIEKIFCSIYLPRISKDEASRFLTMRNVYYPYLINIYEFEKEAFKKWK